MVDGRSGSWLSCGVSPTQQVGGSSRTVVFFTQVVDRAQLGDAYRGKVEDEMIRIVHRVRKGAGKPDRGSELKNGSNTHIGWGVPKNGYDLAVDLRNLLPCNTVRPRGNVQHILCRMP